MSQLPSTPATLPRPPKRAHEEESFGPAKRQRQHGLWTPPEDSTDVHDCYTQAPSLYIPRPQSSPLVHPPYLSPPHTYPSVPLNPRGSNPGYTPSQGGLYTPTLGYIHGNNQQYGASPPSRPLTTPQMGFGNLYQSYGSHVNRHPGPAIQRNDAWGLHGPQTARISAPNHPLGPTAVEQPAPTTRPEYAPRLHTTQTTRSHGITGPMVPTVTANVPRQQLQQQCIQPSAGTQGPHRYSASPGAVAQCASHQTGVERLHRGIQVPAVNVQVARVGPRTQQEQWLIDAQPDLQGTPVTMVPAIPANQGTVGAAVRPRIGLLVPRDVWRLRALPPLERYIAYHHMVELGRRMSQCEQASEEYLKIWNRIVNVQTSLMEGEVELANKFKENTTETRASWSQLVAFQAVETPVNWEMRVAYTNYRDRATACVTPAEDLAVKSQPSTPGQVLAQQKPDTWQKPVPKPQTCISSAPTVISSVPVETIRPDQVKHPQDKVSVPPYPGDIEDFTPHEVTGMYKCNHQYETGACCTEGVTKERKRASISRDKSAWKRQVEKLVQKGDLYKSHITWKTELSSNKKEDKNMRNVEKGRLRNEKKADTNAKKEARKERSKKWREQPRDAIDAEDAPEAIAAPNPLEQNYSSASESDSELSPEEQAAVAETAIQEEVAKKLREYGRRLKYCKRLEGIKKWPNWPRFNEYWEVKHLEAQGFQLSPEQRIISEGDEPSGMPDKNPAFVKKKAEETVPVAVQEPVEDSSLDDLFEDADEDVEQDDTRLDELFEDDGSES